MKNILIVFFILLLSKSLIAQNDTIVYYKNQAPCSNMHDADQQIVIQKKNEKTSIAITSVFDNGKWKLDKKETIKLIKENLYSVRNGMNRVFRSFKKIEGGYLVEELNNNGEVRYRGLSKSMFPLHRVGQWHNIYNNKVVGINVYNEELMTQSYIVFNGRNMPTNSYANADTLANYKGGENRFDMELAHRVEYPRICQENGITGCVLVLFAISESGIPTEIQILKKVDPYLDQAAVDAIKACNNWKPAIKDGKPVKVYSIAPINFQLR